ncbi:ribosomal protein S5 domain 2-like protein [Polychaeton citri CBS 116435]|uniref:Ribosomal RNA-processing protein 41 n=1 Tax=Polychaeton citri CBS 116435 TaxID=1314669 RepID=A0A9P4QEW0_9PEZI|nr:ribosomal protein S5 domain 2-like protein [Polychaeton citri CBS 116435]
MPLDTSTYHLAHLRLDGRRWNELRRFHALLSTQASADGSSYLESGNSKVICTVTGPSEQRRSGAPASNAQRDSAQIIVDISLAGFSGVDRRKTARGSKDRKVMEMQHCVEECFGGVVLGHLYPHSVVQVNVAVLSQDGGVLAACINAVGLALVDAGVPMMGYVAAVTVGSTGTGGGSGGEGEDADDPVLDLNGLEENELPFLTLATVGGGGDGGGDAGEGDKVNVLVMETRMQMAKLESMVAVGLEGCKRVRALLDAAVKGHGKKVLEGKVG